MVSLLRTGGRGWVASPAVKCNPPSPLSWGARGTGNKLPYYEQDGNVVEMLGKDKESILYHF